MKTLMSACALVLVAAVSIGASPETWTGQISDSHCGDKHMAMEGKKTTDRECAQMCIKAARSMCSSPRTRCIRSRVRRMPP